VSASSELRLVGDEPSDAAKLGRLLAGLGSAHNSLVVSLGMMENLTFDTAVRKVKASLRMARSLLVQDVMHVSAIVPKTRPFVVSATSSERREFEKRLSFST
jgi:hypothetical protein